jgi:hypothetical protein
MILCISTAHRQGSWYAGLPNHPPSAIHFYP